MAGQKKNGKTLPETRKKKDSSASGDPLWYKSAVIYELNIRGFKDSNADGRGDFPGLITKLDYLESLGVDCLWLLPMYPTPGRDDGYDIMDYRGINPDFGTLEDFRNFLAEAHKRGLKVIADLVLNHTSDQHPWFQEARKSRENPYHDFYVWSETQEKYLDTRIIFVDTESSNWTWNEETQEYYWHRFFHHQPDLNFDNPRVQEEILDVVRFWLELGLDGFRCDAVPYLFEREGTNCENLPETHEFLKKVRKLVDTEFPGRVLLAEANQWPVDLLPYFADGDEFHMCFNFPLMPRMFMAVRQQHHGPIVDIMKQLPDIPESCQWAIFLRNHDELTLEMCTDEERDYMYKEYAQDREMKINVGIRRRLAPLLDNDRRKIELMNALLFSLPGSPVLYYGDEIGMGDNVYLGDRNGVRTPMQWNDNRNAGFSDAKASKLYLPVNIDPEYNYNAINVDAQSVKPSSLLNWTRHLLKIRKQYKAFGYGNLEFLYPENKKVLVFLRQYEDELLLGVFNLADSSQPVELDLKKHEGRLPYEIIGGTDFPRVGLLPYFLTLGPYGVFLFDLKWA